MKLSCCALALVALSASGQDSRFGIANTTSPFNPPEAKDYIFVINAGSGLDTGCTFRSGGPLLINLRINRVIGDKGKLKANGLIDKVRLEFPAFDVDSAGAPGFPPERDRVSVNGNVVPGEFMSGLNNAWVMQRFDIPVEWLEFPDAGSGPVVPKDNTVRIDIDTASGGAENWCTAVDWVSATMTPAPPRPFVGAHGILSSSSIWNNFWIGELGKLGIPAVPGPDMGPLDSIQNNAGKIAGKVEQAKQMFGVERVNIVAHSKGGLDSRHFIEGNDSVDRLVQLGTPNAGSPLADIAQGVVAGVGAGFGGVGGAIRALRLGALHAPAGYQLTRPHMALYNSLHRSNPKTAYVAIAGDYTPGGFFSDTLRRILSLVVGRGDTIVAVSSVHALPYTRNDTAPSTFPQTGAIHEQLHSFLTAFNKALPDIRSAGRPAALIEEQPAISSVRRSWAEAEVSPQAATLPIQQTVSFGGTLNQGQTATHTLPVDASVTAAFTLFHPAGANLDLTLTDPNGVVFSPASIVGNPNVNRQEVEVLGTVYETISFTGAFALGNWSVSVAATTAIGPVDYAVLAFLEEAPLTFEASVLSATVPLNQPMLLEGRVHNMGVPVTGASVEAAVVSPALVGTMVALRDDGVAPDSVAGDGRYTGSFSGTTLPGNYQIAFRASGTFAGAPFSRETYGIGSVSSSQSRILANITDAGRDTNGNGLFDELVINVPVSITANGTYVIAGDLRDSAGNTQSVSSTAALTTNSTSMTLVFDGATIFNRGVNGPYTLTSLTLGEDQNGAPVPIQTLNNAHNTAAYRFDQFEGGGLRLTGTGTATGIDTDGNGKFNTLRIDLGVMTTTAGAYSWSGRLRDRNGREIALAGGNGNLAAGNGTIRFDFPGLAIGQNGVDGPYDLTDLLLFRSGATLSVANAFRTQAFLASQFEGFQANVGNPILSGAITSAVRNGQTVQIGLRFSNRGTGPGRNIFIESLALRVLSGTGVVSAASPALPIFVGDLAAGASRDISITLNAPASVSRFSMTENGTVINATGTVLRFTSGQSAIIR